jgi:hypothetical protein
MEMIVGAALMLLGWKMTIYFGRVCKALHQQELTQVPLGAMRYPALYALGGWVAPVVMLAGVYYVLKSFF